MGKFMGSNFSNKWMWYPILGLLYFGAWSIGKWGEAKDRFFVERDPSLSYPYNESTVPSWTLWFFSLLIPAFFVILVHVLLRYKGNYMDKLDKKFSDPHLTLLVLGEIIFATNLITNGLKVYTGRLRPNFFALCNYKGYADAIETGNMTSYLANTIPGNIGDFSYCSHDDPDGHFSFPSGHSSMTFSGMTFLTLFLLDVTHIINYPSSHIRKVLRFLVVIIPLFSGCFVAASRVMDYKHNVDDTIWGSFIGIFAALIGYYSTFIPNRFNESQSTEATKEVSMS